jgi:hypothetical protein
MDVPRFDINYGRLENDQWKIEFPVRLLDPAHGEGHWGIADLLLGWKYRFLDEDKHVLMVSVYPQLLAPMGNRSLGLGSGRAELLLPVQAGNRFFEETLFVYAEAGYNVVFGQPEANAWEYGIAAEWKVTEKLECLFEVGGLAFPGGAEPDNPFFKAGLRFDFNDQVALIASAGRSFIDRDRGVPEFASYVGLQFLWGGKPKPDNGKDTGAAE